ncbi:preprotein translocase subunit YajC [Balneolales bacterium ANBcel1]|nr:preprotein translocase subunit YajC [Balneolales bacterium ANBcel1]
MNFMIMLFAADPEGGGGGFTSLIFLAAIFLVFYLFIIRPQSKKQKEIQNKVSEMKKGDKVVTSGGIVGIVSAIEEDSVMLEIDKDVKVKLLKNAIVDVNPQK